MAEVLSQSEIDALLNAISSGDVDATQIQDDDSAESVVRRFDFMRPSKFSKDQLRTIEMLHDSFCRVAQTNLAAKLRAPVEIEVVSADEVSYGEFLNSMPVPTLIDILTVEPLEGNAILEMNLGLVFSIVDRLVGGPGTHRPKLRELTDIEYALMGSTITALLDGLSEAWSSVIPSIRFEVVGAEMNPQFAQVVAPSDMTVLIGFEVRVGGATGMLSLCIPYIVLEPAVGSLTAQSYFSGKKESAEPQARQEIERELGAVSVPLSVELGGSELTVRDLLSLAPGDVVPLGVGPGSEVAVRVDGHPTFAGLPGTRGRHAAVQITRQLEDAMQGALS